MDQDDERAGAEPGSPGATGALSAAGKLPSSDFAKEFPARFSTVLSDARGAIEGAAAGASNGRALIDPESLRRLHEIFRLRIELELEVAAVLWHTAEVVCAVADAVEVLNRRREPDAGPGEWLPSTPADDVDGRGARLALRAHQARGTARWPYIDAPAAREVAPGAYRPSRPRPSAPGGPAAR